MTTTFISTLKCAVCGDSSSHHLLGSTSAFGSYDLDLRPPPPARYTLGVLVQECPSCGYVGESIEDLSPCAEKIVNSLEYRELRSESSELDLVQRFKRYALLWSHDPERAGWSLLHSAWVYDDLEKRDGAIECRGDCADLWSGVDWPLNESGARNQAVLVDVLRRSEHFDEADELVDRLMPHPAMTADMGRVLRFQKLLISRYDVDGYTCEQAFAAIPEDKPSARH